MRWRQCRDTGEFIPVDAAAKKKDGHFIHGNNMEPFVSVVDGTLVRNKREYDEHCKRNNVVNAAEFSPEYYEKAAQKRADFYDGKRSAKKIRSDRREIYETIIRAERNGN